MKSGNLEEIFLREEKAVKNVLDFQAWDIRQGEVCISTSMLPQKNSPENLSGQDSSGYDIFLNELEGQNLVSQEQGISGYHLASEIMYVEFIERVNKYAQDQNLQVTGRIYQYNRRRHLELPDFERLAKTYSFYTPTRNHGNNGKIKAKNEFAF